MNQDQVRRDILHWIENFVEQPHPALGGWPPCPYARSARLKNTVDIQIGNDPYFDLEDRAKRGMGNFEVIIYAYDPGEWTYDYFHSRLEVANRDFLLENNLIVLEDHPEDPEIVNGVSMNQGTYALALVQSLSDLDIKAEQLASKGFYHTWPEEYLTDLFKNRKDPR